MVTISDIAARAGVSRATVSYVLNDRNTTVRISPETRRRVLDAAESLGYRRNDLARAMITGKNPVIGFLAAAPEGELVARLLAGALDEAEARGHFVKVLRLRGNEVDRETVDRCIQSRIAGVIGLYLAQPSLDYLRQEMVRFGAPVALLDEHVPQDWGISVLSDDVAGCRSAIEHLVSLGHHRIALISGRAGSGASLLRERGYREAMEAHGLPVPPGYIVHSDWSPETAAEVAQTLMERPDRPTALLCAGDEFAMAAMRRAAVLGVRTPRELSVVGFGDLTTSRLWDPPLTTVSQPFYDMGRAAVRLLLTRADGNAADESLIEESLPTTLVVRGSTAPLSE